MNALAQELGVANHVTFTGRVPVEPQPRAEMGRDGGQRVENKLAWRHEMPKLLGACEALGRSAAISPTERSVEA